MTGQFVCARVTSMAGVDLSRYRFDYDLTFCCLLMNADGTIYHVYGGRDATDAQSHLSMRSLEATLEKALLDHASYVRAPSPPKLAKRVVIEDYPAMQRRKKPDCVHCHTVHDIQREDAIERKRWKRSDIWIYPDPIQIGLTLDRDEQTRITEVASRSAADRAGLTAGDVLLTLDGRDVGTFGDLQTALHEASSGSARLAVTWRRGDEEGKGILALKKGWKVAAPAVFAWRPSKWQISPKPGFGGPELDAKEKKRLGIPAGTFAFRVGYIVTWGKGGYTGRNARKAGIRKNDVVYEMGGKRDFESVHHVHAWFRLTQQPGSTCRIRLIRDGEERTVQLPVID